MRSGAPNLPYTGFAQSAPKTFFNRHCSDPKLHPRSHSMKPAFCFRISLLAAIVSLVPSVASWGQQPPAIAASTTMPSLITMCEDSDGCSDWGFKGSQGIGLWATGANADLTITHLDATTIAIH